MANEYPDGVSREDIDQAIADFDLGVSHGFALSVDYDLLLPDGRRYPPKAIAGIAARRVSRRILRPEEFSSGIGSKCFRTLRRNGFTIVLRGRTEAIPDEAVGWTAGEIAASVAAYITMLRQELSGQTVSKTAVIEGLAAGALSSRSSASIEYRMRNISAVLDEIGCKWIEGYKPAANVGAKIKDVVRNCLAEVAPDITGDDLPTGDTQTLEKRTRALIKKGTLRKPAGNGHPVATDRTTSQYERSPAVRAYVLREAAGICEVCGTAAPFSDSEGIPYLEVHHVIPSGE